MSSPFADQFNLKGRPQLFLLHGEDVLVLNNDNNSSETVAVIWKRTDPFSEQMEGIGVDSAHAKAEAVVHIDDLPDPHGALTIIRKDEPWRIRLAELQDEWTWKLHLEHARDEFRLPESLR